MLAVADAFDAVTSDRIYRNSRTAAEGLETLTAAAGTQFDREVVDAMVSWVERIARELDRTDGVTTQDLLDSQKACEVAA